MIAGTKPIAEAAKETVDLVILDLGLPDMNRVDEIHRLRGWTDTPIIVLPPGTRRQRSRNPGCRR